jgi:hypothetical protein
VLIEALVAAIFNHPDFHVATLGSRREDIMTVQSCGGVRYLLVLDVDPDAGAHDFSTPDEDVSYAADRLLTSDPSDAECATAELLHYVAATWDEQDRALRQHARAVARSLTR